VTDAGQFLSEMSNLEKKNFKSTVLRQAEAKGITRNIFASVGRLLRAALSIFIFRFSVKE